MTANYENSKPIEELSPIELVNFNEKRLELIKFWNRNVSLKEQCCKATCKNCGESKIFFPEKIAMNIQMSWVQELENMIEEPVVLLLQHCFGSTSVKQEDK